MATGAVETLSWQASSYRTLRLIIIFPACGFYSAPVVLLTSLDRSLEADPEIADRRA